MKRKLFLLLCALLTMIGVQNVKAYTVSDLTAAGWTKINSINQNEVLNNYYIFLSEDESLMLTLEPSSSQGNNAAFFRPLADPAANEARIWRLEKNGANYSMRNVGTSILQMQTEYSGTNNDLRWRTNDQKFPIEWTGLSLTYSSNYWTLTSTEYNRPLGIYDNVTGTPTDGNEVGANDSGKGQKFNIYAIGRAKYSTTYAPGASEAKPVNVSSYISNPEIYGNSNKANMPSGWSEDTSIRSAGNNNRTAAANDMTWLEGWTNSNTDNSLKVKYYQELTSVPNGKYFLKAIAGDSNGSGGGKIYISNGTNDETASMSTGDADISTGKVFTTNGKITIGMTAQGKNSWVHATNFRLYYCGNAISYYSPTTFDGDDEATKDTWYAFIVESAGYYRVSSSAAATIYYSQDASEDADKTASKAFTAGGYAFQNLTAGTYYFKSSATSTIKIEAVSSETLQNGDVVTEMFIANPSFEAAVNDKDPIVEWGGNGLQSYLARTSGLSNKVGSFCAGSTGFNTSRDLYQTMSNLPTGIYVMTVNADAAGNVTAYGSDSGNPSFYVGSSTIAIPSILPAYTYNIALNESANESAFGVKAKGHGTGTSFYFDNFTLTYYETLPDVSITDLTSSAMAADVRAALTSASSTYNSSKTAANYNALQTAIVNAKVSIAEYAAKTGADADWTGIIRNPSFEPNDYRTGWTVTVSSGSSTGEGARSKDGGLGDGGGSKRFFIWTANAGAATVKQTLNELPSGNYKLSAYMASAAGDVFTLSAGSTFSKVIAYDGNATLVEAYFTQASTGNIEISATHSGSWFDVDNFHLTSDPTLPESITGVSGNMNSTVASAQTTAVNAYNAESGQTFANMLAAQTAMNNARASILVYNDISNLVTTYAERVQNNLDDAGQAAYDASTVEDKITSGTYVTAAEAEADLKAAYIIAVKAQTTPGTDMTEAITNPSFESATGVSTSIAGWTNEANKTLQTQSNTGWAKVGTYYAERWHSTGDKNIFQMITGLHEGAYVLTAKAYAGDATAKVYVMVGETEHTIDVTATEDYSVLFDYDGTSDLKIGFSANMGNDANTGWICVDNFRLTYAGETQPNLPLYTTEPMNATAKANANTAINNYNANKTSENYTAAESAIAVAEASKTAYNRASLEGYKSRMGELLAKTNVYTEAAYNKWYANVDDNYANGIYTDEEVVTLTAAGACQGATEDTHKKANRIDDVLLSTWTIGGEQCSDYDKSLYINTWSLEGNIDGSGFQTPFFEYWTSDGNSLGEATMVGTVTGLEVSAEYSVDIWARVRQTNNQTKVANSITMQVGSGSAADLTAGTQVGSSQFYIDHFTATGSTDESGNLTITIAVAANSNVSWLSFKDVAVSKQATTGDVQTYSGLINNDTELVPTTTAPIVDITEATFTGDISANFSSNANGFIIATAEQKAALDDVKNVVVDNTCDNLVLTDGTDFVAPGEFTATSANYSRAGIKLSKDRYATVYLPYAFSTDGLKVMEYTSYEDGVLTFTPVDVTVPSTPYLVRIADDGEEDVVEDYDFSGSGVVSTTDASGDVFKGTYNAQTLYAIADGYNYYGFSANYGDFRQASVSGNTCAAFRAYLKLSNEANARVVVRFDDKTTGILTLDADGNINGAEVMKDGKYIIDNKVVIVKNGVKYGANGQKLN